jgi:hypothetical protein
MGQAQVTKLSDFREQNRCLFKSEQFVTETSTTNSESLAGLMGVGD